MIGMVGKQSFVQRNVRCASLILPLALASSPGADASDQQVSAEAGVSEQGRQRAQELSVP